MYSSEVRRKIEDEIARAELARAAGNEGMARVCARRAVGFSVRAYFQSRGIPASNLNTYELISRLHEIPGLPQGVSETADHLLLRVDADFKMPIAIDLLKDAEFLITILEP